MLMAEVMAERLARENFLNAIPGPSSLADMQLADIAEGILLSYDEDQWETLGHIHQAESEAFRKKMAEEVAP
jgi:hypothetical protein